jgi:uncharacterized protein
MATGPIDYRGLLQEAILGVVRRVMEGIATSGLPGGHHIYLTFSTAYPGVSLPEWVRQQHPSEMTVVLQHQFWDLEVAEDRFCVTLRFGGQPARLSVPFAALTAFVDPFAELGLKLGPQERAGEGSTPGDLEPAAEGAATAPPDGPAVVLPFRRCPER